MNGYRPHADPPRTLAERLQTLNDNLQALGGRLKDAIANAVSTSVAEAIGDAVRGLLGPSVLPSREDRFDPRQEFDRDSWDNSQDPQDPLWHEEDAFQPQQRELPEEQQRTPSRLANALCTAVQTALWWLQQQPRRRPVLSTAAVAVAAGIMAFLDGPVLTAGLGVFASAAGLLGTADAAGTVTDRLGSLMAN